MTNTLTFTVTGEQEIHCDGCEQRIGRALERLDSVKSVDASAQTQSLVVEIDPEQTGADQLHERMELLGYAITEEEKG